MRRHNREIGRSDPKEHFSDRRRYLTRHDDTSGRPPWELGHDDEVKRTDHSEHFPDRRRHETQHDNIHASHFESDRCLHSYPETDDLTNIRIGPIFYLVADLSNVKSDVMDPTSIFPIAVDTIRHEDTRGYLR